MEGENVKDFGGVMETHLFTLLTVTFFEPPKTGFGNMRARMV